MAKKLGSLWSPSPLLRPTRYWAGRQKIADLVGIINGIASDAGHSGFVATNIDHIVADVVNSGISNKISKGVRWGWLKVLRDIGLVISYGRNEYRLSKSGLQIAAKEGDTNEILVRSIFRSYEDNNPLHSLIGSFLPEWTGSPEEFVESGQITAFERYSENSIWIRNDRQIHVSGKGRNEFNQIWNGLIPFMLGLDLVWEMDDPGRGLSIRKLAPIWDWNARYSAIETVLPSLKTFVEDAYAVGKVVTLPELALSFWEVAKVSSSITLRCLETWSYEIPLLIRLLRAPSAISEQKKNAMSIINDRGNFGAFVRRGSS